MTNGRPSRTAERVALRRAVHQVIDHPKVFDDPLALSIVGQDASGIAAYGDEANDPSSRIIRAFMVARSRYAEDQLAEAVQTGVKQYVLLGAGLDTFAYRNPFERVDVRVFEVDHPATQSWKKDRLREAGIHIPKSLTFLPADFEQQTLPDILKNAGFRLDQPSFFSWLGVTPYLTHGAFASTLEFVASLPRGTGVTFDIAVAPLRLTRSSVLHLKRYRSVYLP